MLKENLVEQLYEIIKERIINLEMKLGQKINIQEISNEFNVSQTTIRDVLIRLSHEGLVTIAPRVGYFVIKASAEDLEE